MEHSGSAKALFIIVNAGFSDEIMELAREAGIMGATILNARGESARHELFMGITVDSEKEMILCIAEMAAAERAMEAIRQKAGIKTPAHGVCFMMPVEKVVGIGAQPPQAI